MNEGSGGAPCRRFDDVVALLFGALLLWPFVRSFVRCEVRSFVSNVVRSFRRSFVRCEGRSFVAKFACSFVRSAVRSFVAKIVRCRGLSFVAKFARSFHSIVVSTVRPFHTSCVPQFARSTVHSFHSSFLPQFARANDRSFHRSFSRSVWSVLSCAPRFVRSLFGSLFAPLLVSLSSSVRLLAGWFVHSMFCPCMACNSSVKATSSVTP